MSYILPLFNIFCDKDGNTTIQCQLEDTMKNLVIKDGRNYRVITGNAVPGQDEDLFLRGKSGLRQRLKRIFKKYYGCLKAAVRRKTIMKGERQ
jgi:hypothetical protein